jgi:hypothetical protein
MENAQKMFQSTKMAKLVGFSATAILLVAALVFLGFSQCKAALDTIKHASYNDSQSVFELNLLMNHLSLNDTCELPFLSLDGATAQFCFLTDEFFIRLCTRTIDTSCIVLDQTDWFTLTKRVIFPIRIVI